ncbi:MAG: hypothetical protein PXY39_04685 [archaeon]|nr:hypothetical protein [archaeon]
MNKKALAIILVIITFGITIIVLVEPNWIGLGKVSYVSRSQEQFCSNSSTTSPSSSNATANYDEQVYLDFNESFSSLQYNVTATQQNDSSGFGPLYVLNGRTNTGYWYQTGLAWNFAHSTLNGHYKGFYFFYQVWNVSSRHSVYPNNFGTSALIPLSQVYSGDFILLSLSFSYGDVILGLHDWNTDASNQTSYQAFGAAKFVGGLYSFFTGIMMEWYHVNPLFCLQSKVTFSSEAPVASAWIWIDEWNFTNIPLGDRFNAAYDHELLFNSGRFFHPPTVTSIAESFSYLGTTAYANAYDFDTF